MIRSLFVVDVACGEVLQLHVWGGEQEAIAAGTISYLARVIKSVKV